MPFRIGPWELSLILVIVLLIFGAGKLPQVGTAIGKGIRAFRKEQRVEDEEIATPSSRQLATKKAKH